MNSWETAHTQVFLKLFPPHFLAIRIYAMKQEIFVERQRHDMETDISAGQIGGQLGRKQPRVGTGYIYIHVPIYHERIDSLFPVFHFLYFIQ